MTSLLSAPGAPRAMFVTLYPGPQRDQAAGLLTTSGYQIIDEQASDAQLHRVYRRAA